MLFSLEIKFYFLFLFVVYVTAGSNSEVENQSNDIEEGENPSNDIKEGENQSNLSKEGGPSEEGEEQTTPHSDNKKTSEESSPPSNETSSEDDFVYLTFDLSQDLGNYYQHSEILKSLENIKGLNFTLEQANQFKLWPQSIIPYFIDNLSFDKVHCDKIREYLDVTNSLTGLRLQELVRPPKDDSRWVFFLNRQAATQCPDYTPADFTISGVQVYMDKRWHDDSGPSFIYQQRNDLARAIIGYDCLNDGRAIASLVMALLNIPNQHNSPDRDKEVEYIEKAVIPNKTSYYKKVSDNDWLFQNVKYDFRSVTHFSFFKNSIDGRAVLKPRVPIDFPVGETKGFSYLDLFKIRLMYNVIKTHSDESMKFSNCKKLYKPGYAENNTKNNQDTANVLIFGKETPKEGKSHAKSSKTKTESLIIPILPITKLSNRGSNSKNKPNKAMKNDPLKWDDVRSDDK